ncbi:MAG: sulfurtransferase TusA family protein [Hyphomicrobiales bacterium]|nr:sulfurtransferase TusA family protein [Hyphomicrobiales bacterium]
MPKPHSQTPGLRLVDARGLKCPLPVLHARRAMTRLAAGEQAEVLCTDPVSVIDIPHLVQEMRFTLVSSEAVGEAYRFLIARPDERDDR